MMIIMQPRATQEQIKRVVACVESNHLAAHTIVGV